jgi:hypothetical protein
MGLGSRLVIVLALALSTPIVANSAPASGTVAAWGYYYDGECEVSAPNTAFLAVAAGGYHSLGLKSDSSISAWGWNGLRQCEVPSPNTGFAAVSAGGGHSLGLKSGGAIVAWGLDADGQCDVPGDNSGFTAIAAGGNHSLGLKSDGSIVAWGLNGDGQCDVPSPNSDFIAIAAGGYHSLGLKSNGSIVAWGLNDDNQCSVPGDNSGFSAVAAGGYHSLGLKTGGTVSSWGNNQWHQCNVPSPNSGYVKIGAGWSHSLGLRSDSSIRAWGYNGYAQCAVPSPNSGFTAIATGNGMHTLAIGPGAASVAALKTYSLGRTVYLQSAVVTATSAQMGGFLYVEDEGRVSGIRLTVDASCNMGDVISATGRLSKTSSGELFISLTGTSLISQSGTVPPALALTNRSLGGAALGYAGGVTGAKGLNNFGLLVRTCGKFAKTGDKTFTLDDGSGTVVKCIAPSGTVLDPLWNYATVTGISSCEKVGTEVLRVLRLRSGSDIVAL